MRELDVLLSIHKRVHKAQQIMRNGKVIPLTQTSWRVQYGKESALVCDGTCSCDAFAHHKSELGAWCPHRIALELMLKEKGKPLPLFDLSNISLQ